jgi:hypothetical protein
MATLSTVADGVHVGPLFPVSMFNTVLIEGPDGDVVVDAGFPWSGRRLTGFLQGRTVVEHVVTHAHGDHVGSSAWLCEHTGAPLAMSGIEADAFETGSIAWHAGAGGKYWIAPLGHKRRFVDRRLHEGDVVAGFEVIATPGHSPVSWRSGAPRTGSSSSATARSTSLATRRTRGGSGCLGSCTTIPRQPSRRAAGSPSWSRGSWSPPTGTR